jgi:pimeloyl-ACP methyl ester carboxylesterase
VRVEPFEIALPDEVLADLRERIARTRWPDEIEGMGWEQGTPLEYLRSLLGEWADGFDWRAREAELNRLPHFRAELGGLPIHFVHARAAAPPAVPIVLTHGWPSTFLEMLPLVPLLTDPAAHGIDGPAFDVVIPSLPGYGFSGRPRRPGMTTRSMASLWDELMQGLGYPRYAAGGTDFGAGVTTFMGLDRPEPLIGLHLTFLEEDPYTGPGSAPLTAAERAYTEVSDGWMRNEYAYADIQATKPQTAGYGLNDSPAGLAAWIVEKWRSWGDTAGDVDARFGRDVLLSTLTVFWATETIGSSMRLYWEKRRAGPAFGPGDAVTVPTGFAVFANEFVPEGTPPREWAERMYAVRRWTPMPRGGHFPALEEPELLAGDIAAFFGSLDIVGRPCHR